MKTTLKLTAVAAVAMALTACGGGGGGGGSSIANTPAANVTDWTQGSASSDRSISNEVISKYNNASDLAIAHSQGWKGQGVSVITSTVNLSTTDANLFFNEVKTVAPLSQMINTNNQVDNNLGGGAYIALGTSTDAWNKFKEGSYTHVEGVAVIGYSGGANNQKIGVVAGSIDRNMKTAQQGSEVFFNGVATNGNVITGVRDQSAYIAGSAAIVSSKFNNLSNVEIVKTMDQSRIPTGEFSLSRALAPKGNLR